MANSLNLPDHVRLIHFLHIGKNAGTQFSYVADKINQSPVDIAVMVHKHRVTLQDLPEGEEYLFSIRKPASRFKSGFYSRKRKGAPRNFSEWTAYEAKAFARFEHANDLAEALFEEGDAGRDAMYAIKSISHTARDQVNWFIKCGYLSEVRPPVHIIRQEHYAEDLQVFAKKIDAEDCVVVEDDALRAHTNDYSDIPELSEKAVANLQRWYVQDEAFYRHCEAWIEANGA